MRCVVRWVRFRVCAGSVARVCLPLLSLSLLMTDWTRAVKYVLLAHRVYQVPLGAKPRRFGGFLFCARGGAPTACVREETLLL